MDGVDCHLCREARRFFGVTDGGEVVRFVFVEVSVCGDRRLAGVREMDLVTLPLLVVPHKYPSTRSERKAMFARLVR